VSGKRNGQARNNICTLYYNTVIQRYCLQKYLHWLMSVEDIASQSFVIFETLEIQHD